MEWLNANAGILIVVFSVILVALGGLCTYLLFSLRKKFIIQKLNFNGLYSVDKDTRQQYASLTIGNKSLNDLSITELGVQNGKVNIEFTSICKNQNEVGNDARIVIEQRSAISFKLNCNDLRKIVINRNGKNILKKLQLYALDITGTVYRGKIPAIKKLIKELLIAEKNGGTVAEHSVAGQLAVSADTKEETEND